MVKLYANIPHETIELTIDVYDYDDDGNVVWLVAHGDDQRYIEGTREDNVWDVVERAANAYRSE